MHRPHTPAPPAPAPSSAAFDLLPPGAHWRHRFAALGPAFYTPMPPAPLPAPRRVAQSAGMARELGLAPDWWDADAALQALAGNAPLAGGQPLASVYSGHQFGVWAGQLGDGRALLLGELDAPDGRPWEIQLKGTGRTPYSRMGDGRAVLRSSIREFLASEAMHALGIPTTRALALVASDLPVQRETVETAAVLTRVAPSFIRFGHFEHFSHHGQPAELRALADFVIDRFYPACRDAPQPYAALLAAVTERTATLMAHWQAAGFMHGVMNTDNMSILGLTIDYGPFQFMDGYDPAHICNHSDSGGRYAFGRQPAVAQWNLLALAQALLPLMDESTDRALAALEPYKQLFPAALDTRLAAKLGFAQAQPAHRPLANALLALMARERTDYPLAWRQLSRHQAGEPASVFTRLFADQAAAQAWLLQYQELIGQDPSAHSPDLMLKTNPAYVLRNYMAEEAIAAAQAGDFGPVNTLHAVLAQPFTPQPGHERWAGPPPDWAASITLSCSS
ncbi:YdiU family protein [Comamonadaceae bacterium OH2545_COT-014]|nr:YdiU family protein [Comamonadaceae bacterium OH2545_COT-014]